MRVLKGAHFFFASVLFFSGFCRSAGAYEYHGRILMGAFLAKEKIKTDIGDATNDASIISSRFYLDITKWGSKNLEATFDLRDKHDFFEKLDRENLSLKDKNHFQLRQASVRLPSETGAYFVTAGRFPVLEAGAIHLDGLELGRNWDGFWKTGIFGGLNPRRSDQTHVSFNSNTENYGAYFSYNSSRDLDWDRSFYTSSAVVAQQVKSKIDRFYDYSQLIWQPNPQNFLFSHMYLDFVPRVFVQNLHSEYERKWTPAISTSVGGSIIDVIEYRRIQEIRERLQASPYREAYAEARYRLTDASRLDFKTRHGRRESDELWMHDYELGTSVSPFLNDHLSFRLSGGYRSHFVSHDYYGKLGMSYFSNRIEVNFQEMVAYEDYDARSKLIPIVSQLDLFYFFSKAFFAAVSFEHAVDDTSTIYSGFLKIGYRFGTRETAPIRGRVVEGGTLQ